MLCIKWYFFSCGKKKTKVRYGPCWVGGVLWPVDQFMWRLRPTTTTMKGGEGEKRASYQFSPFFFFSFSFTMWPKEPHVRVSFSPFFPSTHSLSHTLTCIYAIPLATSFKSTPLPPFPVLFYRKCKVIAGLLTPSEIKKKKPSPPQIHYQLWHLKRNGLKQRWSLSIFLLATPSPSLPSLTHSLIPRSMSLPLPPFSLLSTV